MQNVNYLVISKSVYTLVISLPSTNMHTVAPATYKNPPCIIIIDKTFRKGFSTTRKST